MLLMLLTDSWGDRILKRYYVNNIVEHRMVYSAGFSNYDAATHAYKSEPAYTSSARWHSIL